MEHSSQTRNPWRKMYNALAIPVFCDYYWKFELKFDLGCRIKDKVHGTYNEYGNDEPLQAGCGCRSGTAHANRGSEHHVIHPCYQVSAQDSRPRTMQHYLDFLVPSPLMS